ncbi:MAG: hypothetical protein ACYDER_21815 [Ktedonobacteraceae bacterium]
MADVIDSTWRKLSEEVLSGMKEWRQAHPEATFREIEEAVTERWNNKGSRLAKLPHLSN